MGAAFERIALYILASVVWGVIILCIVQAIQLGHV